MKQEHIDLLLQTYPSISHAIADVTQNKKEAAAHQLIGEENTDSLLRQLYNATLEIFSRLTQSGKALIDWAIVVNKEISPKFITDFKAILQKIVNGGTRIANTIVCSFFDLLGEFWDYLRGIDKLDISKAERETSTCQRLLNTFGNSIYGIIKTLAKSLQNFVSYLYGKCVEGARYVYNTIVASAGSIVSGAKDTLYPLYTVALKTISLILASGQELISMYSYGKQKLQQYQDQIALAIGEKVVGFVNMLQKTSGAVSFVADSEYITAVIKAIVESGIGLNVALDFAWFLSKSAWAFKMILYVEEFKRNFVARIQVAIQDSVVYVMSLIKKNDINAPNVDMGKTKKVLQDFDEQTDEIRDAIEKIEGIEEYYAKVNAKKYEQNIGKIVERVKNGSNIFADVLLGVKPYRSKVDDFLYEQIGMSIDQLVNYSYTTQLYAESVVQKQYYQYASEQSEPVGVRVENVDRKKALIEEVRQEAAESMEQNREYLLDTYKRAVGLNDESIRTLKQLLQKLDELYGNWTRGDRRRYIQRYDDIYWNTAMWVVVSAVGGLLVTFYGNYVRAVNSALERQRDDLFKKVFGKPERERYKDLFNDFYTSNVTGIIQKEQFEYLTKELVKRINAVPREGFFDMKAFEPVYYARFASLSYDEYNVSFVDILPIPDSLKLEFKDQNLFESYLPSTLFSDTKKIIKVLADLSTAASAFVVFFQILRALIVTITTVRIEGITSEDTYKEVGKYFLSLTGQAATQASGLFLIARRLESLIDQMNQKWYQGLFSCGVGGISGIISAFGYHNAATAFGTTGIQIGDTFFNAWSSIQVIADLAITTAITTILSYQFGKIPELKAEKIRSDQTRQYVEAARPAANQASVEMKKSTPLSRTKTRKNNARISKTLIRRTRARKKTIKVET